MLHLQVLSAHSLANADSGLFGDVSDPYVVARLGSEERKTGVVSNSLNPVWQEANSFSFEVADGSRILEIEVLNSNTLFKDQSLGLVFVDFRELKPNSWHRRLERLSGGPNSDLEFDIRFDPALTGGAGQQPDATSAAASAEHDGAPSIADGGDDAMWQDLAEQSPLVGGSSSASAGGDASSAHAHAQGGGLSGALGGGLGGLRRSTSAGARLRRLAEEIWEHRQQGPLPIRRARSSERVPQQQQAAAGTHASGATGSSRPSSARTASERQGSSTYRTSGASGVAQSTGKTPSEGTTVAPFNAQECLEKLHNTSCDSLLQQSCLTPSTSVNPIDRDWNKRSCGSLASSSGSCPATPVLMRSRKLLWQRLEREVEWAFDAVVGEPGVLRYEMLSGFLTRMGCLPPEPPFEPTEIRAGTSAPAPEDASTPLAPPATARARRASSPAVSPRAGEGGSQGSSGAGGRARSASPPGHGGGNRVQRSTAVLSQQRNRCLRVLWHWLDPDDTGTVDLLTVTMCFHTLFGSAGEVAGELQELAEGEGGEEFQQVAGLLKRFDNQQLRSDLRELVFYRMKHQPPTSATSRHHSQEALVQQSKPRPLSPRTQELAARATERRRMAAMDSDGTASHSDLLQCWSRKLREALDLKRHLRNSQELDGCTFHPQICQTYSPSPTAQPKSQSPKRSTSADTVFDSLYGNAKARQQAILSKRDEVAQKVSAEEAKVCTFHPDVRKSASSRKLATPQSYPHGYTETRSRLLTGAGQRREEYCMKEERVARLRSIDRERSARAGWTYRAAGPFRSGATQPTNCRGSTPPPARIASPRRAAPTERQKSAPTRPSAEQRQQSPTQQPPQQTVPRPRLFHKQHLIDEYYSRQEQQYTKRMMQYPPLQQYQPQMLPQHPPQEQPQQQLERQAQPGAIGAEAPQQQAPPLSTRQRQRQAQQELYQQQKQQLKQQLEEHHAVFTGKGRQGSPNAASDEASSLLATPLFRVEVRIDPNRPPVHLVYREGNCVADVAAEFAVRHALGPKQAQRLFHMLESQVRMMTH